MESSESNDNDNDVTLEHDDVTNDKGKTYGKSSKRKPSTKYRMKRSSASSISNHSALAVAMPQSLKVKLKL